MLESAFCTYESFGTFRIAAHKLAHLFMDLTLAV